MEELDAPGVVEWLRELRLGCAAADVAKRECVDGCVLAALIELPGGLERLGASDPLDIARIRGGAERLRRDVKRAGDAAIGVSKRARWMSPKAVSPSLDRPYVSDSGEETRPLQRALALVKQEMVDSKDAKPNDAKPLQTGDQSGVFEDLDGPGVSTSETFGLDSAAAGSARAAEHQAAAPPPRHEDKIKPVYSSDEDEESIEQDDAPLPSLNIELRTRLENMFKPLGVVAYSTCCRWGCTGSYDEGDPSFVARKRGIYYIKLFLDGMNYDPEPTLCYAFAEDFEWLIQNWAEERALLVRFCTVLGLSEDSSPADFTIEKPMRGRCQSSSSYIEIRFREPLSLQW